MILKKMKVIKKEVLIDSSLIIGALFVSGTALASDLEEVVVTAQKRTQSQQSIPVAISAFNQGQLESLSTNNLQDLTEHVAGVELFDDRGSGQPTWVIRGVGLADFNANNTPTAAIYYDQSYLPSNILGGIGLFDVQRIEVLKGPQGGLYGRNAAGGAVRVISNSPNIGDEFNGNIAVSYDSDEAVNIKVAMGGSLSEQLAYRIAATTDQGGGWQDSLTTPEDDQYGDKDFNAIKAQLRYQPSDRFDVLVKLEAGNNKSDTTLALSRAVYAPGQFDLSSGFPTPVFCSQALAGRNDINQCGTIANFNSEVYVDGTPGSLTANLQDTDGRKVLSNPINALDDTWVAATIQANWLFGNTTLTSITAYIDYKNRQLFDFDATQIKGLHEDSRADLKSWSQELRLTSSDTEAFTWLAGIVLSEDEILDSRFADASENPLIGDIYQRGFEQKTKSWATYLQLGYQLSEQFKLNAAVRYTKEDKDYNNGFNRYLDVFGFFGGADFIYQNVNLSTELDSHLSGSIGVDWLVSDDALLYAKAVQGFKSGGFSGGFIFNSSELIPYKEEKVTSYEIGLKSEWLDNSLRFNAAAYYYDYRDVQGFQTVFTTNDNGQTVQAFPLGNLGDAEHKGAEFDLTWLPNQIDGLSLQFSASWLDAKITDSSEIGYDPLGNAFSLKGVKRNFSPDFSWSAQARYEHSITESLVGAVQINYSYRDDLSNQDDLVTPLNVATASYPSYEIWNASLSLFTVEENWGVSLAVKNLNDEEYATSVSSDGVGGYTIVPGRPRTWSINVKYQW